MTLNSNEHRIIIAALETYQSMWAVALSELRTTGADPDNRRDEELAQGRYDEAGELLDKFKADPEGGDALAMIGKLDANVAAEQARDRDVQRLNASAPYGSLLSVESDRATLDRLDHNLDDLRSPDEEGEEEDER